MPLTYLITGGAGFIGSHLTLTLAQAGHRVKVFDNFSTVRRAPFERLIVECGDRVEILEADIRDLSACRAGAKDADYILHHAAMASVQGSITDPAECVSINILGCTNMLTAAAETNICRRFVFASSSAVYGDLLPDKKTEDLPVDPLSPYATSKIAGEYLCRNFTTTRRLSTVSLRYFNVFGERQDPNGPYAAVIPRFAEAIAAGCQPTIYGDGEQSRDFVSVHDVVQANILACQAAAANVVGQAFNIGSGRKTTLNDLVKTLSQIVGQSISPIYMPERLGDVKHSLAGIELAKQALSYEPTMSLEDGLRSIIS
jgi:nucleoside-diphosphate-sugar epimerase